MSAARVRRSSKRTPSERRAAHGQAVEDHAALRVMRASPTAVQVDEPAPLRAGEHPVVAERGGEDGELARMLPVVVVEPRDQRAACRLHREVALARHARPRWAAHDRHARLRIGRQELARAVDDHQLSCRIVLLSVVPEQPREEGRSVLGDAQATHETGLVRSVQENFQTGIASAGASGVWSP